MGVGSTCDRRRAGVEWASERQGGRIQWGPPHPPCPLARPHTASRSEEGGMRRGWEGKVGGMGG